MTAHRYQGNEVRNLRECVNAHATDIDAIIADLATLRTAFNTLVTKLNADAANTALDDDDYAAAAALTAVTGADTLAS